MSWKLKLNLSDLLIHYFLESKNIGTLNSPDSTQLSSHEKFQQFTYFSHRTKSIQKRQDFSRENRQRFGVIHRQFQTNTRETKTTCTRIRKTQTQHATISNGQDKMSINQLLQALTSLARQKTADDGRESRNNFITLKILTANCQCHVWIIYIQNHRDDYLVINKSVKFFSLWAEMVQAFRFYIKCSISELWCVC